MRKALSILCITIAFLLAGCQQAGRGEFVAPVPSPLPETTSFEEPPKPKPPRLTPTPSPIPMTPSPPPTPRPILTEKEIEALRRCLNNAIYRHIYHRTDARLKFEIYDKQQIIARLYEYFSPHSNWGYMVFSVSGDYFSFGIDRDYLNGPVVNSFGTRDEEAMLRLEQKECDGEFTFDFDPNPEYDFESQYFDRWPEIREKIIADEMEGHSQDSGEEYWLHFFLYTEEYARRPGEARVYYIIGRTKGYNEPVLGASVYEDGSVSSGLIIDISIGELNHFRKQVFDEVKITIP